MNDITTPFQAQLAKAAETQYPVSELITKRWSARAFSAEPIHQHTLNTLLEAAAWSSSSMNEQPWVYVYAHKGSESFKKMHASLMSGNKWADGAAVMLLSLARKNFTANGQPNRHYLHDVGAANTSLLLQAAAMDIYGHMMGGFHMDQLLADFNIPADLEPVCIIALGYLGDHEQLEEPYRTREISPRTRKPLEAFSFQDTLPK